MINSEKEKKFISVVAYVHNSEKQIQGFLSQVMGFCEARFERCELILVNDASTDDSLQQIREYFSTNAPTYMVSIIKMGLYQGVETCMNAGRDMAIGDYVFEFDDLVVDYDPNLIYQAYKKCLEGNDIVIASSDAGTRLTSRWFYNLYNMASGTHNPLGQETFHLLSRRAINRIKGMGNHIPYRKAVYSNCGLSMDKITYHSTMEGRNLHSHNNDRASLALDSFVYFTDVMERVSMAISAVFFVFTIAVLIFVLYSMFKDKNMVSGWVSTMGFMAVGFTGLFGMMAIVMKYLSVIVDLNFRHQRYLIEDIEKISKN